ncbi:MAG: glycoside hydrolase family 3 [Alphaproteobacteria bacterium]|nr:glycoside hydrolase family 3 [Alphaproteobacteria bacterium]
MKKPIKILIIVAVAIGVIVGVAHHFRQQALSHMVGQMILVGFRGTTPDDAAVKDLAADIKAGKIGGIILFNVDVEQGLAAGLSMPEVRKQIKSRNIIDVDQVKRLNEFLSDAARQGGRLPLFVSIDQEGGAIVRLVPEHGFDMVMPSAKEQSKLDMNQINSLYAELGGRLHVLGFNVNFAPCVDVDVNPESPAIGARGRAFSANPERVSEYGHAAADGLKKANVLSSFKHYPGHGSAGTDTHDGMTDITKTWQEYELEPYENVPAYTMVMVAHVVNGRIDPDFPASLSQKTINGLLRGQLGFRGVVISDDLQMGAIYNHYGLAETLRMSIMAGTDILLLGNNLQYTENLGRIAHTEIMKMVKEGKIPRSRIQESYDRIKKMKQTI